MPVQIPEIGEVRRLRRGICLTQSALARKCGVSQSIIAKIERGRCDPSYTTVKKIFEFFSSAMRSEGATAGKIMSKSVLSVRPDDTVAKAISIMQKNSFSALPVIMGGRALGHISDDTMMRHMAEGSDVASRRVREIMDEPFPRVDGALPATAVAELLKYSKAVLVTRREKVEGIATKADLLKLIKP